MYSAGRISLVNGLTARRPCAVEMGLKRLAAAEGAELPRFELRHLVTLALRRGHVVEAHAGIDGEVPLHAPVVLRVPLGEEELAVRRRVAVGLRVLP